eukprot:TRINITY_DN4602_c0_g1_i17.p1 TRINITY_DN4602_c0_g1~~TRINITY_DN4602_c0_g1_i17.p1  ORF type:complete len:293 (-),score=68.04 TRINITY_DN4602_c0_g1_i17:19-897(-)
MGFQKMRIFIVAFCFLSLFLNCCYTQMDQDEVNLEDDAPKEQQGESPVSDEAMDEVLKSIKDETPEKMQERKLKIYGCTMMIQAKLMKDGETFKKTIESRPHRQVEVHSKLVAVLITKCYKRITVEKALEFLQGLQQKKVDPNINQFVSINYAYYQAPDADMKLTLEEQTTLFKMNITLEEIEKEQQKHQRGNQGRGASAGGWNQYIKNPMFVLGVLILVALLLFFTAKKIYAACKGKETTTNVETKKSETPNEKKKDQRFNFNFKQQAYSCLLYTSPSPRDLSTSRMPSSA